MEFGLLLRLVSVMNLILLLRLVTSVMNFILILFVHPVFKGENRTFVISLKKQQQTNNTLTLAYIQTFTDQFLYNLV